MQNKINVVVGLVLGGALVVAGAVGGTGCDDDNSGISTGGIYGGTGRGGTAGSATGGTGGIAANTSVYNMQLTGTQEVPANQSTATANVRVTLNRTTGAVIVTGNFSGLSSPATVAHIHGPAAIGAIATPLIPLTVPAAATGDVTGTGTMNAVQMNDMVGGQTYVNIHSVNFPDGEIRAQIQ